MKKFEKIEPQDWTPEEVEDLVSRFGSIRKFCKKTGLRKNSVSDWINGKTAPTITSRYALDAIESELIRQRASGADEEILDRTLFPLPVESVSVFVPKDERAGLGSREIFIGGLKLDIPSRESLEDVRRDFYLVFSKIYGGSVSVCFDAEIPF